ncbi:MAG: hypothetical protein Q9162_006004, partial [Coniocarpon cinnabarinum]
FDTALKRDVAIKLERIETEPSLLSTEADVYRFLHSSPGIPRLYWFGEECQYRALVFELLGPSLEDLFEFCERRFSLKTVLMIAEQLLHRLQQIHVKKIIHRDIKPANCLMGVGRQGSTIFVTDLGLALGDGDNVQTGTARKSHGLMGTALFASVNGHVGNEQSLWDDLESLGYMLVYFLQGSLPWQRLHATPTQSEETRTLEMKRSMDWSHIGCPEELQRYFEYINLNTGTERPSYEYLRNLFMRLFRSEGFEHDKVFDWTERAFKMSCTAA